MGRLIYSAITSLDGYIADAAGNFDWAAPDDEVHAFVNDLERDVGCYLYGRRMYETMVYWANAPVDGDDPAVGLDYARIWQGADKVVYSTTLSAASSDRTRIERTFDPGAVAAMKVQAQQDISVGGAGLAAAALRAGLVDEIHLLVTPIIVGGGTRALPDDVLLRLELLDERRFNGGVVHLHYAVTLTPDPARPAGHDE